MALIWAALAAAVGVPIAAATIANNAGLSAANPVASTRIKGTAQAGLGITV